MIDIHSHILPGIDDGAVDLEESVGMCRLATAAGCDAIIATPHQRHPSWWNTEPVKLQVLLDRIKRKVGDAISVHLGAEIRVDKSFCSLLGQLERAGITPLAGSKYLLLEFQRRSLDVDPLAVIEATVAAGWRPIIAHPELIDPFVGDLGLIRDLVQAGALTQLTAMSVTANFGRPVQDCALALIEADLAHFVASDSHGIRNRPPGLIKAQSAIVSRWGHIIAKRLLVDNPQAVLDDRLIDSHAIGTAQENHS